MKRSPLKRRVGLRRTGWLRRRPPKPAGVIEADIWREGLGACAVCRFEGGVCKGRVQGHHVIARQTLRRRGFTASLLDRRNRLSVCEHRHEQHTSGYRPIPRAVLPASVFEFAAELGLGWYLDKHYPVVGALSGEEPLSPGSSPDHACPSPGCPRTLALDEDTRVWRCSTHGPMEIAA